MEPHFLRQVRFPAPVRAGSVLRAKATFTDLNEGPAGATLTTRYTVETNDATKPACIAEMLVVIT